MTCFTYYVIGQVNNEPPVVIAEFQDIEEAEALRDTLQYTAAEGTVFYITKFRPE
jgi:hypothetical protein